MELAGLAVA